MPRPGRAGRRCGSTRARCAAAACGCGCARGIDRAAARADRHGPAGARSEGREDAARSAESPFAARRDPGPRRAGRGVGTHRDRARGRLPRGGRGAPAGRARATLQAPLKRTATARSPPQRGLRAACLPGAHRQTRACESMIAHLHLDALFAASSSLIARTCAGGGSSGPQAREPRRLTTASYEARAFGIGLGDELAEARRRCPQAVFVPPDHARYKERSQEVRQLWGRSARASSRSASTRAISISRRWWRTAPPARGSVHCRRRCGRPPGHLLARGRTQTVAKIASDRRNPGGIVVVPPGGDAAFLAARRSQRSPGLRPHAGRGAAAAAVRGTRRRRRGNDHDAAGLAPIARDLGDRLRASGAERAGQSGGLPHRRLQRTEQRAGSAVGTISENRGSPRRCRPARCAGRSVPRAPTPPASAPCSGRGRAG